MHHTATKGNIGVARATADLLEKGWDVLVPVCATSPFDLGVYREGRFLRVQVKYRSPTKGRTLEVAARRQSIGHGRVMKSSTNIEIDVVCIYDAEAGRVYYVPASRCPISLRLDPPKNNQRRGVSFAADYTDFPI